MRGEVYEKGGAEDLEPTSGSKVGGGREEVAGGAGGGVVTGQKH